MPPLELIHSQRISHPWSDEDLALALEAAPYATLVELLGKDTNFRSQLVDLSGSKISEVELPYLRSAPVYHLAEPGAGRRLTIRPNESTREAAITVNLYAIPLDSSTDRRLVEAWRALTAGLQVVEGEQEEAWLPNLQSLELAASLFDKLDDRKSELWARYFGAYFRYFPLYRYQEALREAEQVLSAAEHTGLSDLAMLGHQLAGQILIEQDPATTNTSAGEIYLKARRHFEEALRHAKASGNGFEIVWSLNNLGITSKYLDEPERSIDEYSEALDHAMDLHDAYLVSLIGMNVAVSQESMGEINKAIETLHRLETELVESGQPAELEHVWSLLGGYYLKRYEFPKALQILDRALALSGQLGIAESLGRNQLLVAQVYRELGQLEKSLQSVELAIPNLELSRSGRGLRRAYALIADLHRQSGHSEAMRRARLRQEEYLATEVDRARWIWDAARDALAIGDEGRALELFEETAVLFEATPFRYLGQLARLHVCVLRAETGSLENCASDQLLEATGDLLGHEASAFQLEGRFLMAKLLAREGRTDAAWAAMAELIEDLGYYRSSLPGVLGAWYWDARSEIFDFYLRLALDSATDPHEAAYTSLMALNRLRNLGLHAAQSGNEDSAPSTLAGDRSAELRQLLARRDYSESLDDLEQVERDIDLFMLEHGRRRGKSVGLNTESPFELNVKALPENWSLLTYHLAEDHALAWTATNGGLQLHKLGRGDELKLSLQSAHSEIRTINSERLPALLAQLGEELFVPIGAHLRPNILLLGAGALSDFPFEALIVDGEYLLRDYRIHNVMSFNDPMAAIAAIQSQSKPQQVFLAGHPDSRASDAAPLPASKKELEMVAATFSNAKTKIYAQETLSRVIFLSPEFWTADLVHIASHATVDLAYPELSRIELSDDFLTPADLLEQHIEADVVVLSACSTTGLNRFEYDSHLGFVSEFIIAGAGQVMASLWSVPDRRTAEFFELLYSDWSAGTELAGALRNAKLKMIDAGDAGVDLWSAFQLYTR